MRRRARTLKMVFIKILPSSLDQYLHSFSNSLCREMYYIWGGEISSVDIPFLKQNSLDFNFSSLHHRLLQGNNLQEPEI